MDWDTALGHIQQYIEKYGITYRGGVKRFLMNNQQEINTLLTFVNFKEVISHINQTCHLDLDYNYCNRVFLTVKPIELRYQRKNNDVTVTRIVSHSEERFPSTQSDELNVFYAELDSKKNINALSKKLIMDNGLTESTLREMGIFGIQDSMTVYTKIDNYCEKLKSQAKREKYKNLFKE